MITLERKRVETDIKIRLDHWNRNAGRQMMGPNVKEWLRAQLKADLKEARDSLREQRLLHKEYAKRNRGEGGWKPGIWYQEQELEKSIPQARSKIGFLRKAIEELE